MSEKLEDKMLGSKVKIVVEHKDYMGILHKVGEKAHIYLGCTYGALGSNEIPIVFNKKLPFEGTDRKYIEIIKG